MASFSRGGPVLGRAAGAEELAMGVPAVAAGGHPDAVAETPGGPGAEESDEVGAVVRSAHGVPNTGGPAGMPAGGVGPDTLSPDVNGEGHPPARVSSATIG
jgi:hypothetical protein